VILSRAFLGGADPADLDLVRRLFDEGVRAIRACESRLARADAAFFEANRIHTRDQIYQVAEEIGGARR
jgi:hypothetical protein